MSESEPAYYVDDDEELSKQLHELFVVNGDAEVEIHAGNDLVVLTRSQYFESIRQMKMAPAERIREQERLHNQFKAAMARAKIFAVDLEDETQFGLDVNGDNVPINDREFVLADEYSDSVETLPGEVGAYVDPQMILDPSRIVSHAAQTN